jgi:hypothetical protein
MWQPVAHDFTIDSGMKVIEAIKGLPAKAQTGLPEAAQ